MSVRVVAVDWSGAKTGAGRTIWLAEAASGRLLRLEPGRDRDAVATHLVEQAKRGRRMVIGLDFAFSFPLWFARRLRAATAHDLWRIVGRRGERWLAECAPPFWGRAGTRKPAGIELFRRTEREFGGVAGIRPKSVFQIAGAGAVGTASLRGMPVLRRLHDAGFSIWPFDRPGWPRVVEIYPRVFTGPVRKSDAAARRALLRRYGTLTPAQRAAAQDSEDAFDAAISAIEMSRHARELVALPPARDDIERIEGAIWLPECAR